MNLADKLKLKAAREGKAFKNRCRHTAKMDTTGGSGTRAGWAKEDYQTGHASTHEMIAKLAGALERSREWISIARYKMLDVDNHPANLVQKLNDEALQELEKWLGGR